MPVKNFDTSLPFYQDLGFKVILDAQRFNWMEVGTSQDQCTIGLYEYRDGEARKPGRETGIVLDTDDINEFHKRLSSKGVKFTLPPKKQPWGGIVANFVDPDGNELQVVDDPEHYTRNGKM